MGISIQGLTIGHFRRIEVADRGMIETTSVDLVFDDQISDKIELWGELTYRVLTFIFIGFFIRSLLQQKYFTKKKTLKSFINFHKKFQLNDKIKLNIHLLKFQKNIIQLLIEIQRKKFCWWISGYYCLVNPGFRYK